MEFTRFDEESGVWKPALANRIGEEDGQILYSLVVNEFSLWTISGSSEPPPVIFKVDDLVVSPDSVSQGEPVTISATVSNILAEPAECVAVLWINGAMHSSQTLALGPNTSKQVGVELSPNEGNYEVRIDRLAGTLTVGSNNGTEYLTWIFVGIPLLVIANSIIAIFKKNAREAEMERSTNRTLQSNRRRGLGNQPGYQIPQTKAYSR